MHIIILPCCCRCRCVWCGKYLQVEPHPAMRRVFGRRKHHHGHGSHKHGPHCKHKRNNRSKQARMIFSAALFGIIFEGWAIWTQVYGCNLQTRYLPFDGIFFTLYWAFLITFFLRYLMPPLTVHIPPFSHPPPFFFGLPLGIFTPSPKAIKQTKQRSVWNPWNRGQRIVVNKICRFVDPAKSQVLSK